eukprot:10343020-Alexandrium_andersonii.AAC.1
MSEIFAEQDPMLQLERNKGLRAMARCASAVQRESKDFYALVDPAVVWEAAHTMRNSESTASE